MSFSGRLILALGGQTAVGKTEVAKVVAQQLSASVRHCGQVVKDRAKALGCAPGELSRDAHVAIDSETRLLAESATGLLILDGCFLDRVLASVPDVVHVLLTCDAAERANRFGKRGSLTGAPVADAVRARDAADESLRASMYGTEPITHAQSHVLDTTALSVDQVAALLQELVTQT